MFYGINLYEATRKKNTKQPNRAGKYHKKENLIISKVKVEGVLCLINVSNLISVQDDAFNGILIRLLFRNMCARTLT